MSLPLQEISKDGVTVWVVAIHIFDVMDGVIVGEFSPERAAKIAHREAVRIFGRDCEIEQPIEEQVVCLAHLVSRVPFEDNDGSEMLIGIPYPHPYFSNPKDIILETIKTLEWGKRAKPFNL